MRLLCATVLASVVGLCQASRIILVPLDNRPAAGQFAQMIAAINGVEVQMPPYETLGRFTSPGNPDAVLDWLLKQDYSDVSAVVVSADMIGYGGLIASRVSRTSPEMAIKRLKRLEELKKKAPNVRLYGFTSVMRLAPTATRSNVTWRMHLARYVGLKNEYDRTKSRPILQKLRNLQAMIPAGEITRYYSTRERNHTVQRQLVWMSVRTFDYLVVGQDDAQPFGPHVPETTKLRGLVEKLNIGGKVYFCEGVDQNSNVLISRAMLNAAGWTPRVRIVYSDPHGRKKIGFYESKTIQETVRDQILASGARPALPNAPHDYSLYVNTPDRRDEPFLGFLDELQLDIDQGGFVALADINLGWDGTCDRELFTALRSAGQVMKLLSFAGWNTAGNTLGTAIPAANVTLLAQRLGYDSVKREVAQKSFLLHRIVDDVIYHRYTRPRAYGLIADLPDASKDETYGPSFTKVDAFVRKDMSHQLEQTFRETLFGLRFDTPAGSYEIAGMDSVKVFLPWPRAYEVRVEFALRARPLAEGMGVQTFR